MCTGRGVRCVLRVAAGRDEQSFVCTGIRVLIRILASRPSLICFQAGWVEAAVVAFGQTLVFLSVV